jgi:hypothetical protein
VTWSSSWRSLVLLVVLPCGLRAADQDSPSTLPWNEIKASAQAYVDRESPASVFPFAPVRGDDGHAKLVFAHYFLPFPLSFDNKPAAVDSYAQIYLSPEGSDAHLAGHGGYRPGGGGAFRERPMPVGPWNSPYWRQINFAIDILRAQRIGIDGFGVDLLSLKGRLWTDLQSLMDVSTHVAPDFQILLEPDMSALKTIPADQLQTALLFLAPHPGLARLPDGRLLIAPFDVNNKPPEYWQQLFAGMSAHGVTCAFLPIFLGFDKLAENGKLYGSFSYGMSDWGFRDIDFAEQFDFKDAAHLAAPYTSVWMMPVATQDARPKGLVAWEADNTGIFRYLWTAAISGGSQLVHLPTWNDYSESTEFSPCSDTQYLFYDLSAYYIAWFKTGHAPAITRDAIYYCHRSQIFPLPIAPPKQRAHFAGAGKTPFVNRVELIAFLTAPATMEIEQNGKTEKKEATAGLTVFDVPAQTGRPEFQIVRDGRSVIDLKSGRTIVDQGEVEDPIYCGGSSTRPFVSVTAPIETSIK